MAELLPRREGARACSRKRYDIGLNIDAEEADRLELSLDLLEALCLDPELAGWNGIGFVVQAYQKRCPFVIDWLDRSRAAQRPPADGAAGQGRLLGHARSSARRSTGSTAIRSSRARSTPTSPTSPARASCWRRRTRLSRNSPRTTRRRWRRSTRWPAAISSAASTSSSACTAWASRSTTRSSAATSSTGRAASTRRSARTRRCSPTSCGACSRTAPTPRSSTASPIASVPIDELVADPVDGGARDAGRSARRTPQIALPRDALSARSRTIRAGLDLADERRSPRSRAALQRERATQLARRAARWRGDRERAAQPVRNPADPRRRRRHGASRRAPTTSTARAGSGAAPRRAGRATPPPSARATASSAPPTCSKRAMPALARADRARGRQDPAPTRSPRCARRSISCATTRAQARGALRPTHARAARPGGLHQPVEFPAGDLHRPGRAPRSPPATRCSPSRPSRRR